MSENASGDALSGRIGLFGRAIRPARSTTRGSEAEIAWKVAFGCFSLTGGKPNGECRFTIILGFKIPETLRDIIIVWSVLGAIAVHTMLWFTDHLNRLAKEAHAKAVDPDAKAGYVKKFGQKKYDEDVAFVTKQLDDTTRPESGPIFKAVTILFSLLVGPFGFLYVAVVNPHHKSFELTARQFMAVQVVAVLVGLLVFCAINFMLSDSTKGVSAEVIQRKAPISQQG